MDLTPYEPLVSFAVATAMGMLVGLERERPAGGHGVHPHLAGARTFTLVALLGALASFLSPSLGPAAPLLGLAGVVLFEAFAYRATARAGKPRGLTTEVALVITYLAGVLATAQAAVPNTNHRLTMVAMIGVVLTALLSAKPTLRSIAARVSQDDMIATVKFLIVAVVVLPLLPDRPLGPYGVWNPRDIGWMVVLIAGISFVGYVAARVLGARGLWMTGVLGGLVSSTAVTMSFSPKARTDRNLHAPLAMGIVGACTVMFPRVLVEVAVVGPGLLPQVGPPLGVTTLAGLAWLGGQGLRARRRRAPPSAAGGPEREGTATGEAAPQAPGASAPAAPSGAKAAHQGQGAAPPPDPAGAVELHNPFELGSALGFGALYALILLASRFAGDHFGDHGTFVAGALAGLSDVDAITLSMTHLADSGAVTGQVAAGTIFIGVATNTLVKAGLAVALGGRRFGARVLGGLLLPLLAGALALLLLPS